VPSQLDHAQGGLITGKVNAIALWQGPASAPATAGATGTQPQTPGEMSETMFPSRAVGAGRMEVKR